MDSVVLYLATVATIGTIYAILCLGVNVRYGWTGNLDLSFYMFIALGAYVQSVLTLPRANLPPPDSYILGLSLPFPVGVLGAMTACALGSLLLGSVALRTLRGDYFAILTIVTTLIAYATISQVTPLFNGYTGLFGVPQPFGDAISIQVYPLFFLGICVALLLGTYVFVEVLYRSPFGRAVRGAREDERAAAAFGRNVYSLKLKAFVISGALAGLGGALIGTWLTSWNPSAWSPIEVLLLYAAVFVGGTGNNRGVVIGAFFVFVFIQEVTRYVPLPPSVESSTAVVRDMLIAVLIGTVLWFRPQGVLPEPRASFAAESGGVREEAGTAVSGEEGR